MALVSEQVHAQLRARFGERLQGQVGLTLYTRPGGGRLILPSGVGCPTCDDARELAAALAGAAPEFITLEEVDVSVSPESPIQEVPTLAIGHPGGGDSRIRYQGLPSGFEFATVVDAIERVSTFEAGLTPNSVERLERITEPVEVMVFSTPT